MEDVENEKLTVTVSGQETFTAGDMNQFLKGFEVLNPELVICNMDTSTSLDMELTIQKDAVMFLLQRICLQMPRLV